MQPLPSATFFKKISNCLPKNRCLTRPTVAWPPTVTWPSATFFKKFRIAWNVEKSLFDSRPTVDLRPLSRDRSATFFKFFSNCLKRLKNVVWISRRSRDLNHCRVTVQRLFSKFSQIAWNDVVWHRRSRDLRPLSRHRSATFFKKYLIAWNVEKSLFDSRPTRDLRLLSRDRSATFFKKNSNCLKRRKIVVWQYGRVTSDHSRTASHTASQMYISFVVEF